MSSKSLTRVIATLLTVAFIAPTAFFAAPQRASASAVGCIGGLLGLGSGGAATAAALLAVPVTDIPNTTVNGSTMGSSMGTCINDVILIPLARMAMRMILQKMTASVISWINGSNGTGQPSYVLNISAHLQGLGDAVALPLINQIATNLNSPFGNAIASALKLSYTQQTSMGGFLAANMCTLSKSSANVPAYLAGNWSQGGVGAWFALTTQSQNNPYMLYQAAQSQLGSNVSQAQTNRRQDLLQSSGFLSWCGSTDAAKQTQNAAATAYQACQANCTGPVNGVSCGDQCQSVFTGASGSMPGLQGINPGDTCTNDDGTPGKVQTPGSVIHDYTQKAVVASGFDQIISATDLDAAIGQIINALLSKVLGTVGGLFGASQPSGSTSSIVSQLNGYTGSSSNATNAAGQTAQDMSTRATAYKTAWDTIANSANTAKTSINSLINTCTTNVNTAKAQLATATDQATLQAFIDAATAQIALAQAALISEITPVLTSSQAASATVATTQAFALKVQSEASSVPPSPNLAADLATLVAMPPSVVDLSNAQTNVTVTSGGKSNPSGSLTVGGGTIVDQMKLISTNAAALEPTVCTFSPDSGPIDRM